MRTTSEHAENEECVPPFQIYSSILISSTNSNQLKWTAHDNFSVLLRLFNNPFQPGYDISY